MQLQDTLNKQREFFKSGRTLSYEFRKTQLEKLQKVIEQNAEALNDALHKDLRKSETESWLTEIGFVLGELKTTLKHLKKWMKPERAGTNLVNLPGSSHLYSEPFGVVLIIAPWNYPFNLLFAPLVGAMAAGNCVVLKSSEFAAATTAVMKKMIQENFEEEYILFTDGDGEKVVGDLMNNFIFDHVFYTGSTAVGKIIYKMAAENLVPVTLELGGKSPCIVERDANLEVAARRIAFPKFSNAGQMCVAPDYVLVHTSVRNKLIEELKKSIDIFFEGKPAASPDYCRIINEKQFDRITGYLKEGTIIYGGEFNKADLFISPTLMVDIKLTDKIMQEEIFGPILPILTFETQKEVEEIIAQNKNPLAFYLYTSSDSTAERYLKAIPFGGGCINNSSVHLLNDNLPFGGRGASGMGHYHGKYSFNTFSHKKAVLNSSTWLDPLLKYPPFKNKLNLFKKVIG